MDGGHWWRRGVFGDTSHVVPREFSLLSSNEEKFKILLSCSHLNTLVGNEEKSGVGILHLSHRGAKCNV